MKKYIEEFAVGKFVTHIYLPGKPPVKMPHDNCSDKGISIDRHCERSEAI